MKRSFLCLAMVFLLIWPMAAGAELLKLPLDFEPAPMPQGGYPAQRGAENYDHYEDPSITADYEMVISDEWKITYYMARVKIADGSQLRTAAASTFDKKALAPTQAIARRMNAVVAINGDYYTGNAGRYVLRQGRVFRDAMAENQDLLLIDEDGDFHIILAEEHPESMDKTVFNGKKITNALCFGPALVRDGEIVANLDKAQKQSNPKSGEQRIAICQMGPLDYMVITVAHWGMTLEGFAKFVASFEGVQQAYNLDGGNSCHIVFMGNWRNKINTTGGQDYRPIPDIVYFASAWQPD